METVLDTSDTLQLVAGRRLVRRLGSGRRWSAFSTVLVDDAVPAVTRGTRPTLTHDAVLLRATADAAERGLWRRAAILSCLDHPHILRLLDVAEDVGGQPCLLVERLTGGTLAALLRRRESIAPGEAVTILAPIAEAVHAAHLAGVQHGSISTRTVVFAADGRPVLAGWCDAVAVDVADVRRDGPPISAPGDSFAADWRALAELVDAVLRATSLAPSTSFTSWVTEASAGVVEHELANRFAQRIHALARPLPVLLEAAEAQPIDLGAAVRASFEATTGPASGIGAPTTRRAAQDTRRRGRRGGDGPWARGRSWARGRRITSGGAPGRSAANVQSATADAAVRTRPSRRRLAIVATAAAATLTATALLLLPVDVEAVDSAAMSSTEEVTEPRNEPIAAPTSVLPAPDDLTDPLTGQDPVLAAERLLSLRDECRTNKTGGDCVTEYTEVASPFHETEVVGGVVGTIEIDGLQLVDRQGDAAVLRAVAAPADSDSPDDERQPVTLLVLRGETGWRLREVFTAG